MRLILCAMVATIFAGCGVELLTTTAIQSELQAEQLKAVRGQVQRAAGTTSEINVQRAIDTYRAEKGSNPPSLEALVPNFLPTLPVQQDGTPYGYNPNTGQLLTGAQAGQGSDLEKLQQVQQAILRHGQTTGWYPATLDALVPHYLPAPPRTASGQPFLYNNQTGQVALPGQAPQQTSSAPRPGAGMGGAGPMGEVMTGIGMQQQLGNMNQSGASSAGTHMRGSVSNNTGAHDQRQQQVMDDLGF
jgi:hypothetical protein